MDDESKVNLDKSNPQPKTQSSDGAPAMENIRANVRDTAESVGAKAGEYAAQAKGAAADEVNDIASALRNAAEEMRGGSAQERTFSQIAESLADASESLRNKDLAEMYEAVNGFARRNPLIFLGSAALIGFAATRFAKASSETSRTGAYGRRDHQVDRPEMDRPSPSNRTDISGAGYPSNPTTGGGTLL